MAILLRGSRLLLLLAVRPASGWRLLQLWLLAVLPRCSRLLLLLAILPRSWRRSLLHVAELACRLRLALHILLAWLLAWLLQWLLQWRLQRRLQRLLQWRLPHGCLHALLLLGQLPRWPDTIGYQPRCSAGRCCRRLQAWHHCWRRSLLLVDWVRLASRTCSRAWGSCSGWHLLVLQAWAGHAQGPCADAWNGLLQGTCCQSPSGRWLLRAWDGTCRQRAVGVSKLARPCLVSRTVGMLSASKAVKARGLHATHVHGQWSMGQAS